MATTTPLTITLTEDDLYAETVALLRDVGRNFGTAGDAVGRPIDQIRAQRDRPMMDVLNEHWDESDDLREMRSRLVNVAIRALVKLDWDTNFVAVREAIEEADAGWLWEQLFRRASDALPDEGTG